MVAHRAPIAAWLAVAVAIAIACAACASATGKDADGGADDDRRARDAAPGDGAPMPGAADAGETSDPPIDGGTGAPADAAVPPPVDAASGTSLDPDLDLPDPSGDVCTTPGGFGECGLTEVCRFYDTETGRCESCDPCGNLGASCSASDQCDILFMCHLGRCTNFCTLGTFECGPVEDCLDIGHPTHGVCAPL
jgi:hypothetical protein